MPRKRWLYDYYIMTIIWLNMINHWAEILCDHQLKIADDYSISIDNVKKIVPNFFDNEHYVPHYKKLQPLFKAMIKNKKVHRVLDRIRSIKMTKNIHWI